MSGYDFSLMDFSGISIPCADLSYGIFEGTNFTGANLQRVNFTESWLKDATFAESTMKGVEFGLTPELKLDKEASCIAYSPKGDSLIIGTLNEIIVLKRDENQGDWFTEVRRLKGHVGQIKTCSFSEDGKYMITGGEDRTVRVWKLIPTSVTMYLEVISVL